MFLTPGKTMCVERMGTLLLQSTGPAPISEPEWDAYLGFVAQDIRSNGMWRCAMQYSLTQAPSSDQRKQVAVLLHESPFERFALVSASAFVRGAVSAIGWVNRGPSRTRAFAPGEERASLEWMAEHAPFDVAEAMVHLDAVVKAVGYPGLK